MMNNAYVHYGCGFLCAPGDWLNFDASPTLFYERIPVFGQLYTKNGRRFPTNVRYGDIVKGLPVVKSSASAVYCSHVLDCLSYEDVRRALKNTREILRDGGIFRLLVADCHMHWTNYMNDPSPQACSTFMERTGWGRKAHRNIIDFSTAYLGHGYRLWMWDFKGLEVELSKAGFRSIRRAEFGDSDDGHFHSVENPDRWRTGIGIECRK
jgi:hypothetical protein